MRLRARLAAAVLLLTAVRASAVAPPAQPTGTALLGTFGSQVVLSWAVNGNAGGTQYDVVWSSAGGTPVTFSTAPAVVGSSASATVPDLTGGYAYSFAVRAGTSAFDASVSTTVPVIAGQPVLSSGTYALGVSSIAWSWGATPGATGYRLFDSAGNAVSALLPNTQFSFAQTGLTPNASAQCYLAAYALDGSAVQTSTNSGPFTRFTLAAQTNSLAVSALSSSFASLTWSANANSAATAYDVLWWTGVTSTVTFSTQAVSASAGVLPAGGTVYFTVRARNGEGLAADFDATLYAAVPSTYFAVGVTTIPPNFSGVLTFAVPTGPIRLRVSSGTFASQAALTVLTPDPALVPAASGRFAALGTPIAFSITATDPFGAAMQPQLPISIEMSYLPSVLGGVSPTNATIARYDAAHASWVPLLTQRGGSALSALTEHLTLFQVLGVGAASDLSGVTVGPNPLRPVLNPGQVFTFRALPAGSRVRVFTILGEKVADVAADQSGLATWDGRNPYGSLVGSGVYIAVLEGPGKRAFRLAVER
ncbi:MAG: fibronectin type III domain-containing protein [Elusimicrobia bacterium]|nr:fibronectin type III domain-containing protein [Elusimicrobiota bacterium]